MRTNDWTESSLRALGKLLSAQPMGIDGSTIHWLPRKRLEESKKKLQEFVYTKLLRISRVIRSDATTKRQLLDWKHFPPLACMLLSLAFQNGYYIDLIRSTTKWVCHSNHYLDESIHFSEESPYSEQYSSRESWRLFNSSSSYSLISAFLNHVSIFRLPLDMHNHIWRGNHSSRTKTHYWMKHMRIRVCWTKS